jgi:hypothetical protein
VILPGSDEENKEKSPLCRAFSLCSSFFENLLKEAIIVARGFASSFRRSAVKNLQWPARKSYNSLDFQLLV